MGLTRVAFSGAGASNAGRVTFVVQGVVHHGWWGCLPFAAALRSRIGHPCIRLTVATTAPQAAERELGAGPRRLEAYNTKELTSLLFAYGQLARWGGCSQVQAGQHLSR